jgi:hypothetical protein
MRNVICCWCNKDAEAFENHVPLYFCGKRNVKLGFENRIDVLFLSGYERLDETYKQNLQDVGYRVHDAGAIYNELAGRYSALHRFGDYEKKCFLRWPVIATVFPRESIIHYDGDVVLNEDPAVIARLLERKTFVLQGCPALTAISDQNWFTQYQEQLDLFVKDIEEYSARAWKERKGWEISERDKWAGQRYREIVSSDQDLLSHLIHTDRIVQDNPPELLRDLRSYLLFENPLYLHGYTNDLHGSRYTRTSGIDYIDGKRILMWHMQSDFTKYLSTFMFRKKYLRWARGRMSNHVEKEGLENRLHQLFLRYLHIKPDTRLSVYKHFFGDSNFSEVLTGRTWWQEGAFA